MFPHERALVKRLADKPFALIGINSDKDKEEIKAKNEEENITWRSFWCGPEGTQGAIPSRWNVRGWPTLYLIDHNGVIRQKWTGSPGGETIDKSIDDLLKEMGVEVSAK